MSILGRALLILLCGWLGACVSAGSDAGAGEDSLQVALDDTSYAPGDTVGVRIVNGSGQTALFAFLCDAAIEGRTGSGWTLFEPDCSHVRVRPTTLAAGETTDASLSLDALLPDNPQPYQEFRVRLRYQHQDNAGYRFTFSEEFRLVSR